MKKRRFPLWTSAIVGAIILVLMGVTVLNIPKTVNNMEIALADDAKTNTAVDTTIAVTDDNGYTRPLGESTISEVKAERVIGETAGVQWMVLGMLGACLLVVISLVVKYWLDGRRVVK